MLLWNWICLDFAGNQFLEIRRHHAAGDTSLHRSGCVLWNSLADYYIRAANFPRAHDVYEEAVNTVVTVRDFSQVFDAYAEFMESMVTTCMEALEQASNDKQKAERKASSAVHVWLVKLVESWRL